MGTFDEIAVMDAAAVKRSRNTPQTPPSAHSKRDLNGLRGSKGVYITTI